MSEPLPNARAAAFRTAWFSAVTARPWSVVILVALATLALAAALPGLRKDTRADAFVPADHPARVLNREFREIFGLGDPLVIAVVNPGPQGIFNPRSLALLHWLSRQLEQVPNIDPERITSLATEQDIRGTAEGMEVTPLLAEPPTTQAAADAVRAAVMDFPLHLGSLVAADGSGALIVAEQLDQDRAQATYEAVMRLVSRAPLGPGDQVHVAGEGALAGHLGAYIDADATRLNPVSALVILLLCLAAFRTLRGMLLPGLIVLATTVSTLGLMALCGVPFYVITNALPVALIGIGVADSIHVLTEYYQLAARHPHWSGRQLATTALCNLFRPIGLTTATTMAGFLSLALSALMPPMRWFGWFALLGVGLAWIYTITLLPALLALLPPQRSSAYPAGSGEAAATDRPGRLLAALGGVAVRFPAPVVMVAAAVAIAGLAGASRIEVNDSLLRAFQDREPIVIADRVLNQRFDGTYFLDLLVSTPAAEDLFRPAHLRRIEALQRHLAGHPLVADTVSIVDYLKQMHRAMHGDDPAYHRLPGDAELIAQYFLLYSGMSDPRDFDHLVDYDYRLANVRITLKSDHYAQLRQVIDDLQGYLRTEFNTADISARPAGRAFLNSVWMGQLAAAQTNSILLSLALVLAMSIISFRSVGAGLATLAPIAITVLGIHAYMGFGGLWLSASTVMFAAIAIGLGVDFAIHTMERLRRPHGGLPLDVRAIVAELYPGTGRALLFNFLTLAGGFGVLAISKVRVLNEFGLTVALAIALSFCSSLLLLPALARYFPTLCGPRPRGRIDPSPPPPRSAAP
jgi:uncharacterized protein